MTEDKITEDRKYWRQVLDRVVSVVITLSKCNLAFRGHRETDEDMHGDKHENRGNFLEIMHLLAKYDPLLQHLLKKPKGTTKYLSGSVQNELIEILMRHVTKSIVDDLATAPCVSLIMDTTMDLSKTDQLSKILRYVTIEQRRHPTFCEHQ